MHQPYSHPDLVPFLAHLKKKYKPDLVVVTGDEVDKHNMSFHDSDPDLPNAGDELCLAIQKLKPIYKLFPNAIVLESNHGSLLYRKALHHGISQRYLKGYREVLEAPLGWSWVNDLVAKTPLGKVYFHHSKGANVLKNSQAMGMSFVQSHHHESFEIRWWGNPEKLMFGATIGCLVDPKALAFAYGKNNLKRPVIGCAVIIDGVPELIPMVLDKTGRWVGR